MIELRQIDDDHYNPFEDGWNERITYKQRSDNPFGVNNWKFYEWEKGWLAADEVIKQEAQNNQS